MEHQLLVHNPKGELPLEMHGWGADGELAQENAAQFITFLLKGMVLFYFAAVFALQMVRHGH